MLSHFHTIPERNGQRDGWTNRFAASILHESMLTPPHGVWFSTNPSIMSIGKRKSQKSHFYKCAEVSRPRKIPWSDPVTRLDLGSTYQLYHIQSE